VSAAGDAAVLARLRSDSQLANAIYEGTVTNPPTRYASVFAPLGADTSDRLGGPSNVNDTTYTIHSVATTVEQAKWVGRRVVGLLTDHVIPGVGRLTHPVSLPPRLDTEANPPLWYLVDQFDLTHS
jgi:hypothetical protein